jgi:hypothetical protein
VNALLAPVHLKKHHVISLATAFDCLEFGWETFAIPGQGSQTGHGEVLQQFVGQVDRGVKPVNRELQGMQSLVTFK